jgi:putative phage-type endonuclease
VVLGVSPFKTRKELWQEKMGLIEPVDKESPAIKRGKTLEGIVADLYAQVKDRKVEIVKQKLIHPQHPYIYAHIDRRIIDGGKRGPGVLEIKCPGIAVFNKCKREGIQEYYIIQLQHYLGVTGLSWGAFAVFSAEQWELLEFDIHPDKEFIKLIFNEDQKFWQYVQNGEEPPEPEVIMTPEEMKEGYSAGTEIAKMDKINPHAWAEMVKKYQEAKMLKEEAEALLDMQEEKIKTEMERIGASVAEGAGARIYWKEQKGKEKLDKKAFAKGHPAAFEIYESYLKTGKPSRPFRAYFPRPIYKE